MQRRDDRQQSQREPVGQGQVALPDEPREGSSAHAILESELDHQRSGNGLTTDAQQSSTNPSSMASTTPTEDRSPRVGAGTHLCRNIFLVVLDHTMPIFCNFSFI